MTAPYHATAADRIAATVARLGRKIWASSELPDDMSRALWWKQRRWFFDAFLDGIGHEEDRPGYHSAVDERDQAVLRHKVLIEMMWQERRMHRLAAACVARTGAIVAAMRIPATEEA